MRKRAIGIVRVSQLRREGDLQSPEDQAQRIAAVCRRENLDLLEILNENADGRNVSGAAELVDRPGLGPAVAAVKEGKAEVIVAAFFDRFFRSPAIKDEVVGYIEAVGGQVLTADLGVISNATAADVFNGDIHAVLGRYVRGMARERSIAAVTRAIDQGKVPWSQTPPGYNRTPDSKLVCNPETAPIVLQAFEKRDGGATIAEVRAFLAENNIERSYHGTMVLLSSRIYLGEIHFKDRVNLEAHEPIIPRDLFERVQRLSVPRGPKPKSERLLARLDVLRCSGCRGRMVVGLQTQNGRSYPFYKCGHVRQDCAARVTISAEMVEQIVVDSVKEALSDAEGRASAAQNAQEAARDLDLAQAELNAAIRVLSDFADEAATRDRLSELRTARDEAQTRVDRLGGSSSTLTISARTDWDRLALDERRALVRATIESVTVGPGRGPDRITVRLFGK